MERRDFILKSGSLITAAAFLSGFGNQTSLYAHSNNTDETSNRPRRPDHNAFSQPILKAVAIGLNSPSPHNTQSWKFKLLDDSSMYLYVDDKILLPATDPTSRQIHMGAGCFIETLVIGATSLGFAASVNYFPEGYQSAVDFGNKPVAKIQLTPLQMEIDELANYITTRHTNRKAYEGTIISDLEFGKLYELTGPGHSRIRFINSELEPYIDILKRAFEIETRTYRTNEETRMLFRYSEKERAEKGDGLSIPQMGYTGLAKYFAEKSLDNGNPEKWHSEKGIRQSLKGVFKGIESSKGLVTWTTDTNSFEDWVKTGRDYVRFSLALTKQGFYAHPYSQAMQEYEEMSTVQNDLNILHGIEHPQKIQLLVRIGRSSPSYLSYRRTMESYITQ